MRNQILIRFFGIFFFFPIGSCAYMGKNVTMFMHSAHEKKMSFFDG